MSFHLSALDYSLWFLAAAFHMVLASLLASRGAWRRLPFFTAQACVCLGGNIVCFVLAQHGAVAAYVYTNFCTELLVDTLLAGFLYSEVYLCTFGPRRSLPSWVSQHLFLYVTALYGAVLVTGALLPDLWLRSTFVFFNVVTRCLLGALASLCLTLLIYSNRLGISWRRHTLLLTCGLAFTTTASLLTLYARYFVLPINAGFLRHASALAYLMTLVLWSWAVFRMEEVKSVPPEAAPVLARHVKDIDRATLALFAEDTTNPPIGQEVIHK